MCEQCDGAGRIYKELFKGVITFEPCTCEAAEQNMRNFKKSMKEWRQRIDAANAKFSEKVV